MLKCLFMKGRNAIFILGGGARRGEDGRWQTIDWNITDAHFGRTADRLRVIAASVLYRRDPKSVLVASGGQGQLHGMLPRGLTIASIMKQELVMLGVPERAILLEDASHTTAEQLSLLVGIIEKNNLGRIMVLSNRWHIPRVQAFIEHSPQCTSLKSMAIETISAEEVLLEDDPATWRSKIDEVYADPSTKAIIESEQKGVKAIREGTYRYQYGELKVD